MPEGSIHTLSDALMAAMTEERLGSNLSAFNFWAAIGFIWCSCFFALDFKLVSNLGMIKDHLLFPHVFDCVIRVDLNWVVVLVDLNSKSSASGEVVRLWKMAKAVVLHGLK